MGVVLVAGTACSRPVNLEYRYAPKHHVSYVWTIHSNTQTESAVDSSSRTIHMVLDLQERLLSKNIVRYTVTPVRIEIDGIEGRNPASIVIDYMVTPTGLRRASGGELQGLPPIAGVAEDLKIPLPTKPLRPGLAWNAPLRVEGPSIFLDLTGHGRLQGFELTDQRRLAILSISRRGKARTTETVEKATLQLDGTTSVETKIKFDISRGVVVDSASTSISTYGVSLPASTPTAKITVRQTSTIRIKPG